jgi:hypothetical protein
MEKSTAVTSADDINKGDHSLFRSIKIDVDVDDHLMLLIILLIKK